MYKIVIKLNNKETLTAFTETLAEAQELCNDVLFIEKYIKVSEAEKEVYKGIEGTIIDTKHFKEYRLNGKTIAYIDVI